MMRIGLDVGSTTLKCVVLNEQNEVLFKKYERHLSRIVEKSVEMLREVAEQFPKEQPIYIEVGMGKGRFLMDMARLYPEINFIGIEKYSSVLLRAVQKLEEEELPNVRLIRMDAEDLENVFAQGELDRIYLNFSDPWPKDRHAKRRLESRQFLARYNQILKKDGTIEFKTDNRALFDFALEEVEAAGWTLKEKTFDLHADARLNEGNVMTEYEERFSAQGNPICKYIISR